MDTGKPSLTIYTHIYPFFLNHFHLLVFPVYFTGPIAVGLQLGAKQGVPTGFSSFSRRLFHIFVGQLILQLILLLIALKNCRQEYSGVLSGLRNQMAHLLWRHLGLYFDIFQYILSHSFQMVMSLGFAVSHSNQTVECHIIDSRFTDKPLYHQIAHVVVLGKLREMIKIQDSFI